jgi:hypothetical protein
MQSGTSAPATTFANMLWYDTTNNIVKMRNEDNDAWISLFTLDQSGDLLSAITATTVTGTSVVSTNGATLQGLTVGRGAGSVATNTAVGASALAANTTGNLNTAVGSSALVGNTSGTDNTALGYNALFPNTTGSYNTAIGRSALVGNTTGSNNTALGWGALPSNTTASNNTAVGYQAGYANSTGTRLTAIGKAALYSNTTGVNNTTVGIDSLANNSTGGYNSVLGDSALNNNTTGSYNTGLGYYALVNNTTANNNTAVGYQAGYSNTTGAQGTYIGNVAGYSVTTGLQNQLFGYGAGYYITTGSKNTILGAYSGNNGGLDIRTASNYIVLSDGDGNPRGIFDNNGNWLVGATNNAGSSIGFKVSTASTIPVVNVAGASSTNGNTCYEMYSTTASAYRFYVGFGGTISATSTTITAISDQRLKENIRDLDDGLEKVMALQPRKFDWKEGKGQDIKNARGFIAQEFETVFPDMIEEWKDPAPEGEEPYKAVNANLVPTLVKAIQEQQVLITTLTERITALENK